MAHEEALQCISVPANANLSAIQYHFTTINASAKLAAVGAGLASDGVLQNKPAAADRPAQLGISGVTKLKAGAAVTGGDDVTPDSTGRGVTATSGDVVGAKALEDASGAGVLFSVLLKLQAEPLA